MIDEDRGEVVIVATYVPTDSCFRPGFFPFGVIGEAEVAPYQGDDDDGCG